jgi:hypothetical protein
MKVYSILSLIALLSFAGGVASGQQASRVYDAEALNVSGGVAGRLAEKTPLIAAFEAHHFDVTLDLLAYLRKGLSEATANGGDRPLLSGNPAGGFHYGRWIELARYFDFLNVELDVAALATQRNHYLAINALIEAMDSALLVMPNARSNASWRDQEDPVAYARGTAVAYALGGHMHVPWCLYDGSQFHRFYGSLEGHQPIFRMIHEHADFLDGYVPLLWHVLAVPYGEQGVVAFGTLERRLGEHFDAGIPTLVRLVDKERSASANTDGDFAYWLARDAERFGNHRFQGAFQSTEIFGQSILQEGVGSPFIFDDHYSNQFYPPIPRAFAGESNTPLVLHLIQRAGSTGVADGTFSITLKPELIDVDAVANIEIVTVQWQGDAAPEVSWQKNADGQLVIKGTGVNAWAMLRVHTHESLALPHVERAEIRQLMAESEIPLMRMIRFGQQWRRPPWVDELLAGPEDPLDGYHITRISWSYDKSPHEMGHARQQGWYFHGSVALIHSWMSNPDRLTPKQGDLLTFPHDWQGWARYPDGGAMMIRAEWNPPRYGASFASPLYHEAVLQRCMEWVNRGAAGIQLDDVSGMMNRVWQYGGDFSEVFFEGFKSALIAKGFPGVTESTPLDALRLRVLSEMDWMNASRRVNANAPAHQHGSEWISIPYRATSAHYPGQVWVDSPAMDLSDNVLAEWTLRFDADRQPYADLRLMDAYGTEWFAGVVIRDGTINVMSPDESWLETGIAVPSGEWITIAMKLDRVSETFRIRLNNSDWSAAFAYQVPWLQEFTNGRFNLKANPLRTGLEVRRLRLLND